MSHAAPKPRVSPAPTGGRVLPRASIVDTLRVVGTVLLPVLARGVIVRRPSMVRLAERVDVDSGAVELLQELRHTYGGGPLRLRIPGRRMVVVLSPEHVQRVLAETPDPFTPATQEKRAALQHFQPHGVLISSAADRRVRRPFNESTLDTGNDVHRGAEAMIRVIHDEVDRLLDRTAVGTLAWDEWHLMWDRLIRRLVLGDSAADDEAITEDLVLLRATANWAFLHPTRTRRRERFLRRVRHYLDRADPGSLAAWAQHAPQTADTHPEQQVPQWLFAFDAASWASFRAVALLATHPQHLATAREEVGDRDLRGRPQDLPFLRATMLEALRLWPTTPAVLRETTRRTRFEGGPMPERTSILIYAPLFHRDDENLLFAHRFDPELWARDREDEPWPLIPFSGGTAICPGQNLVLHTVSTVLARLVTERELTLEGDRLDPAQDLPGELDMFTLRFGVAPRS